MSILGGKKRNASQSETVRNDDERPARSSDREEQEYYKRHISKIPVGCRACGGPYPSCKSSCPMFDD